MSERDRAARPVMIGARIAFLMLFAGLRCQAQPSTLYSYDSANHLVQATTTTGGAVQYQYDLSGNRIGVSAVSATALNLNGQQNINIGTSGQNAVLTFNATPGESVSLNFGNISTSPANSAITIGVYDSGGNLVGSVSSSSNPSLNLNNLTGGSYTVIVSPANAATGSLVANDTSQSDSPATDAPLPLWSYIALGGGLILIAQRNGRRMRASS